MIVTDYDIPRPHSDVHGRRLAFFAVIFKTADFIGINAKNFKLFFVLLYIIEEGAISIYPFLVGLNTDDDVTWSKNQGCNKKINTMRKKSAHHKKQ